MPDFEQQACAKELENAAHLYRQHGDNPQLLAQDIWREMQKIDMNKNLTNDEQRERVKETFLLGMHEISNSKDAHKAVYVEFTNDIYSTATQNFKGSYEAGQTKGWDQGIFLNTNNERHQLIDFKQPTTNEIKQAQSDGNTIYGYLGPNHDRLNNLQALVFDQTSHGIYGNGMTETEKTRRDRALDEMVEKANNDPNRKYRFEIIGADQSHYQGLQATDIRTGAVKNMMFPRQDMRL